MSEPSTSAGESSDQLPEEGPPGSAADDVPQAREGAAREASRADARAANRTGQRPGAGRDPQAPPERERA